MDGKRLSVAKRLEGTESSVWVEFGDLADKENALNVGQGYPDFFPPQFVADALRQIASSQDPVVHQYTRSYGHPRLVKALSDLYSILMKRSVNSNREILVSVGAYGALYCAHQGLIDPGDEVILLEPFFDCYEPMVKQAGGIPVLVPLKPTKSGSSQMSSADWKFDCDELASKFNPKTKAIIVNNPNNPLGKVFTLEELEFIADLCKRHDVIVFSDEVYEWLVYRPNKHIRIATLPGMWERTISIGSAGKTFSITGWKLGWAIGPEPLLRALCIVHQNCNYTCPTPLEEALAVLFETELSRFSSPESYFEQLREELLPKRDRMAAMLSEIGMVPIVPEGGYFMVVDISNLDFKVDEKNPESRDYQFVKWMTVEKKFAAIPNSAFYSKGNKKLSENLVRFCFMKDDSTLAKAAEIIREWKKTQ